MEIFGGILYHHITSQDTQENAFVKVELYALLSQTKMAGQKQKKRGKALTRK